MTVAPRTLLESLLYRSPLFRPTLRLLSHKGFNTEVSQSRGSLHFDEIQRLIAANKVHSDCTARQSLVASLSTPAFCKAYTASPDQPLRRYIPFVALTVSFFKDVLAIEAKSSTLGTSLRVRSDHRYPTSAQQ